MNKIKFVLRLAISIALAFTFGCGEVEPFDSESSISSSSFGESGGVSSITVNSSSSSDGNSSSIIDKSSSSIKPSSSAVASCVGFVDGTKREHYGMEKEQFCDSRDGKKYVYVEIGTQTWMAENLNYAASDSRCNKDSEANCTTYGRLYNWATAMAVCPSGWHLSSNDEWKILIKLVGGSYDFEGAKLAGTKLKAKEGWNNNNGTDEFGFSALPSGYGDGGSSWVGGEGEWWSSTEYNALQVYNRVMDSMGIWVDEPTMGGGKKNYLYSVRCVKD